MILPPNWLDNTRNMLAETLLETSEVFLRQAARRKMAMHTPRVY